MAFTYYSPVTIDHTKCGASDSSNFAVLFNTIDARFKTVGNGGHVQNSSGFDIRPYSDSGLTTALSFELERYNASTGEVVMWIKEATVSHTSDTVFYLGYGDSGISTDGSSTASWDSNFNAVYHFKDGSSLNTNDSTVNAVNLTGHNTPTAATGQIDGGVGLVTASTQYLDATLNIGALTAMTVSAWIKATSFPDAYNTIYANAVSGSAVYEMFVKSTGKLAMYMATPALNYDGTGSHTLSTGTWYLVHMTYNSTQGLIGYVNGASDGTVAASGNLSASTNASNVGRDPLNTGRSWNGIIDEMRISHVARSADWITTEYNNQNSPSTFYTVGTEVSLGGVNAAAFFRIF
jgi:hypothetical protein